VKAAPGHVGIGKNRAAKRRHRHRPANGRAGQWALRFGRRRNQTGGGWPM